MAKKYPNLITDTGMIQEFKRVSSKNNLNFQTTKYIVTKMSKNQDSLLIVVSYKKRFLCKGHFIRIIADTLNDNKKYRNSKIFFEY